MEADIEAALSYWRYANSVPFQYARFEVNSFPNGARITKVMVGQYVFNGDTKQKQLPHYSRHFYIQPNGEAGWFTGSCL